MMENLNIQTTTAMFPGLPFLPALEQISRETQKRPELHMDWVQLCPQSFGCVNDGLLVSLKEKYPNTKFQLHSNVRIIHGKEPVHGSSSGKWVDVYLQELIRLTKITGCGIYSIHSGYEDEMSLQDMFSNVRKMNSDCDITIAIEGLYPERNREALVRNWDQYQQLLDADIPYAIDLSHLNIVAKAEGHRFYLVQKLLASYNCKEVHLSSNHGRLDSHLPFTKEKHEWWWPLLEYCQAETRIFSEENLRIQQSKRKKHNVVLRQ